MARISDPFAEHVSVMKALYQEYQKAEDFDNINTINTVITDMRDLSSKQDAAVKSIIRDLSKEVKQLEVSSSYPHAEGSHKQRVAGLENDITDMRSKVTQLTDDTREAQVQRQQLAERTAQASARIEDLHAQQKDEESMLRRQMILYQVISKTKFRKDVGDRLAGTVSDVASSELRPFDMDPHNFSHFEMVNKLWQLI